MTNYQENKEYYGLVAQWAVEKRLERQANARRLVIEAKILDIVKPELKESGTNNFVGGLKVLTGLAASCDKDKIDELYRKFNNNELYINEFPFKRKWEPDLKALKFIQEKISETYNKYFLDVVTLKPKKPTFLLETEELN